MLQIIVDLPNVQTSDSNLELVLRAQLLKLVGGTDVNEVMVPARDLNQDTLKDLLSDFEGNNVPAYQNEDIWPNTLKKALEELSKTVTGTPSSVCFLLLLALLVGCVGWVG